MARLTERYLKLRRDGWRSNAYDLARILSRLEDIVSKKCGEFTGEEITKNVMACLCQPTTEVIV